MNVTVDNHHHQSSSDFYDRVKLHVQQHAGYRSGSGLLRKPQP